MWFENAEIRKPVRDFQARESRLFPRDAREMGITYKGELSVRMPDALEHAQWVSFPSGRVPQGGLGDRHRSSFPPCADGRLLQDQRRGGQARHS